MHRSPSRAILRILLVVDGLVFLAAAAFNLGLDVPVGGYTLRFPVAIWQAGAGEAVIGVLLIVGGGLENAYPVKWTSFVLSVVGIAFGLSSRRVEGPARQIHIVLVPLAALVLVFLIWSTARNRRSRPLQG